MDGDTEAADVGVVDGALATGEIEEVGLFEGEAGGLLDDVAVAVEGETAHWDSALHSCVTGQIPQIPPHPSAPHALLLQL